MKKIKIIPLVRLDLYALTTNKPIKQKYVRGCLECFCKVGLFTLAFFLFVMGLIVVLGALGYGLWWLAIIIWLLPAYAGKFLYSLLIGRTYKPGKSFSLWRMTKEKMARRQKIYGIATIILAIIMLAFVFITGEFNLRRVLEPILAIIGTYFTFKVLSISYKVHEDVDFVVNEKVAKVLGFEIDEKIQCSYADYSENRMLVVTNRKIFYTYKEDNKQLWLTKRIDELSQIGVVQDYIIESTWANRDVGLVLYFMDGVRLQLKISLRTNMTSNPDLFMRKFLIVLDEYLLGSVGQRNSSRRRVIVASDTSNNKEQPEMPAVRSIDVSESIMMMMETATPITDNRNLEL